MEYILIFISAIFVNNIVLSQFLGICPFLGVSKKVETAMGMSAAVAFVLTIATIVTFLIQKFVLDVFDLGYLQTITFILVIAGLADLYVTASGILKLNKRLRKMQAIADELHQISDKLGESIYKRTITAMEKQEEFKDTVSEKQEEFKSAIYRKTGSNFRHPCRCF